MKKIRIGMVCPYGWDTPGGVQTHIRDLTQHLIDEGHYVSVLAPISDDSISHEDYVVNAGKPISIPVNGSVARVIFGPIASSRAKQWVASGDFDLLHLHEPAIPSLSLLACSAAEGPLVGTFHVSTPKKKAIYSARSLGDELTSLCRGDGGGGGGRGSSSSGCAPRGSGARRSPARVPAERSPPPPPADPPAPCAAM